MSFSKDRGKPRFRQSFSTVAADINYGSTVSSNGGNGVQDEFRVTQSLNGGYCVELCRDGKPYVTFVDGLTRPGAEREARSLTALWDKISVRRTEDALAPSSMKKVG